MFYPRAAVAAGVAGQGGAGDRERYIGGYITLYTRQRESKHITRQVLRVWRAKEALVLKRSLAAGYAGLDNPVLRPGHYIIHYITLYNTVEHYRGLRRPRQPGAAPGPRGPCIHYTTYIKHYITLYTGGGGGCAGLDNPVRPGREGPACIKLYNIL